MDEPITSDIKTDDARPSSGWVRFKPHTVTQNAIYWSKRISYRLFRLSGELVAVLFGLGIAWLYALSWLSTQQSMDLKITKPWIAQGFAKAFEGNAAEVETVRLRWLPASNRISFEASDIAVTDESGVTLQNFDRLETDFTFDDALKLNLSPKRVALSGGTLTWVTDEAGDITIGLGTPDNVGQFGPVFRGETGEGNAGFQIPDGFEGLEINQGQLFVVNQQNDLSLRFDVDQLRVDRAESGLDINLAGHIQQTEQAALINMTATVNAAFSDFKVALQTENIRPDELAPPKGRFKDLRRIAAPVNLVAEFDYATTEALKAALIDIFIAGGQITGTNLPLQFDEFQFTADLRPGEQILSVSEIALSSDRLSFQGQGDFTELGALNDGDVNSSPVFDLTLRQARLDATPFFEKPLMFKSVRSQGELDFDAKRLNLSRLVFSRDKYDLSVSLDGEMSDDYDLRLLRGSGEITGQFVGSDLVDIWPVKFAEGARSWIDRSILSGQITPVRFQLDLGPDFFETPALTPERLKIDWGMVDGVVRYISTMTPVSNVIGRGQILGNELKLTLDSGQVGTLNLTGGTVDIPRLMPKGGDIIINVDGTGPASDMMALINQKPFQFADRYGVNPQDIGGTGDISATITRPLLVFFDQDRITYSVEGNFKDAVAPFKMGEFPIHQGNVRLSANKQAVNIKGPAQIGPWPVTINWNEYLGDDPRPTSYDVSGVIDRSILDEFGIGFREFFDGYAQIDIKAFGPDPATAVKGMAMTDGPGITTGTLRADFKEAELSLGESWSKTAGEEGVLTTTIDRLEGGTFRLSDITAEAPGLLINGGVDVAQNLRLIDLNMNRLKIDGLIDAALQLKPDPDQQRFTVMIDGEHLNVSPWTNVTMNNRSSALDIPLLLTASLNRLTLKPGYDVSDSRLLFSHTGQSVSDFRLAGMSDDGAVNAEMTTEPETGNRAVTLSLPDASKAADAFLGLKSTRGGELELRAKLPPLDEEGPILGQAVMRDFNMQRTPFLAQILSLASLTGMGDMLNGDGLRFEKMTVPFTLTQDDLRIRDARLRGPVLGMTGDGDINLTDRTLDFDGTLVPAYTANSLLGDIPLVGDILVGKKGSGVLALSYSVKGPFEKTQISVNPLSAITPGFLRGIFKSDREKIPDEVMAEIKEVAPKKSDKKPEETGP